MKQIPLHHGPRRKRTLCGGGITQMEPLRLYFIIPSIQNMIDTPTVLLMESAIGLRAVYWAVFS